MAVPQAIQQQSRTRGVISVLTHLHKLGLSFGNINPKKVMLSDQGVPKLCGIGDCRELTKELIDYDFRALGKFIAYTFCRRAGRLPKVLLEDAYDELSNKVLLRHLKAAKEIEAYDIAAYLIDHGQYPVESILCRPFMWAVSRKLGFFRDGNDFLKSYGKSEQGGKTLNRYIIDGTMKFSAIEDGEHGWKKGFPQKLVDHMEHPPKIDGVKDGLSDIYYQPFYVLDLLRFLRNLIAQREDIYLSLGDVDAGFLGDEEELMEHIREKFPPLLTRLYNELEPSHVAQQRLAKYFDPNY